MSDINVTHSLWICNALLFVLWWVGGQILNGPLQNDSRNNDLINEEEEVEDALWRQIERFMKYKLQIGDSGCSPLLLLLCCPLLGTVVDEFSANCIQS